MKKYFVTITVVAVALVPSAFAVNNSLNSRVAKLERQVRAITATANATNTRLRAVEAFAACVLTSPTRVVGLSSYGTPPTEGYLYRHPTQGDIVVTALDFTEQGDRPHIFVPTLNPTCVSSTATQQSNGSRRTSGEPRPLSWKRSLPAPRP